MDVLTPKQAKLFGYMSLVLRERGFKVFITARNYDYTVSVLKSIGLEYNVIGIYAESLKDKIAEEAKRTLALLEVLPEFDFLMAFPNPVASRIAFGLGKPYIAFTDSPHSKAPSKLSLPLARAVIFSSCIPKEEIERYIVREETIIVQFNGVDELEWIRKFSPDPSYIDRWNLKPYEYIVIRPPEIKASYYNTQKEDVIEVFEKIIKSAISKGYKVVYLPRYHNDYLQHKFKEYREFIIPSNMVDVDASKLSYYARLVVTGGGTMARESALLGTPGICLFPTKLYVNECVSNWGFPLYHISDLQKALNIFNQLLNISTEQLELYKMHAKEKIKMFEIPSEVSLKILEMFSKEAK